MSLARSARAINPSGRNEVPKLTVWTELTRLVTVIYYALFISELRYRGKISIQTNFSI